MSTINTYQRDKAVTGNEIRILDLQPSITDESPIRCDLRVVSLAENPQYEALSYVWGDPANSFPIEMQGSTKHVTRNLYSALEHLRLLKDKPRTLWIDQLCIDQDNCAEKAKQVRLMRQIYRQASCCIVWLGEIPQEVPRADALADALAVFEFLDYYAAVEKAHPEHVDEVPVPPCLQSPEAFEGPYKAFVHITACNNIWWDRIWTVQEAVIPPHAVLTWGHLSISWKKICQACDAILFDYVRPLNSVIWAFSQEPLDSFLANVIWLTNMKHGLQPPVEIFTIWRSRKATDPRDKVYGLLGLCKPGALPRSEKCCYDLSVATVYTNLTIDLIVEERSLKPLLRDPWLPDGVKTEGIPRWALDLSSFPEDDTDMTHFFAYDEYDACAGKPLDPEKISDPSSLANGILNLDGAFIDEIELVGEPMDEVYKALFYGDTRERGLELMREWKNLAEGYPKSRERVFRNMTKGEPGFCDQDEAFGRLMLGDVIRDNQQRPIRQATREDAQQVLDLLTAGDEAPYDWNINHVVGRMIQKQRFFVTKEGFMGLGHIDTRPGDQVWVFCGGRVPFVVRPWDGENEIDFDFVSRCEVQGIMDGEVCRHWERHIRGIGLH